MGSAVKVGGATVVVVGAGYPGKRHIYERMAELGARLVMVDEADHWSEQLVIEGVASQWIGCRSRATPTWMLRWSSTRCPQRRSGPMAS